MKRWARTIAGMLLAPALGAGPGVAFPGEAAPTDEQIRKITAAVPDKPYARPAKPRKLLVFSLARAVRHDSIPHAARALEILGRKTGAYEAVLSDDPADFEPERIRRLDAICLNNATGELFLPEDLGALPPAQRAAALARDARRKKSLMDWLGAGGGLVAIHGAIDAFPTWPEFRRIAGASSDGRPWLQTVTLRNDDPDHPVNAGFGGSGCRIRDEIYQFQAPYSRGALRVLTSLDVAHTRMDRTVPSAGARCVHRTDDDFAVSWLRSWRKGRVFYCSLGHRPDTFWNRLVLRHYLAGIQFALGDLKADTTPSAELFRGAHPADGAPGFQPMFSGKDTAGWTCKPGSWAFDSGVLARKGGGDIWSNEAYGDFVLDLEFKLARGTNSGVFLRAGDLAKWEQTAIEVQLYDSYAKARPGTHDCGAIFDCLAPAVNAVRAPGRWNRITITARGPHVVIVLNRKRIIDTSLEKWTQARKNPDGTANKYATPLSEMPRRGRIGLQDHGYAVWFRNVRIKARK